MMYPQSTAGLACSVIQKGESQRDALKLTYDMTVMYSKTGLKQRMNVVCLKYGRREHNSDDCWSVAGFLKWHDKYKKINLSERNHINCKMVTKQRS